MSLFADQNIEWYKRKPLSEKYSKEVMKDKEIKVILTLQSDTHTISVETNSVDNELISLNHYIISLDELYCQLYKELDAKMTQLPDRSSEMTVLIVSVPQGTQLINGEVIQYIMSSYQCEIFNNEETKDNALKRLFSRQVYDGYNLCLLLDSDAWVDPANKKFIARAKFFKI